MHSQSSEVEDRHERDMHQNGPLFVAMATGTLLLTGSRLVSFASGYAVHVVLARHLQPGLYGVWGLVLGILNVCRMLMMSGATKAISRFTAEDPAHARAVAHQGLKLQIASSGLLGLIVALLAPVLAKLFGDTALVPYIRIAALFVPAFAVYAVYLGCLNGLQAFGRQAQVLTTYSVLRMLSIIGLVLAGYQVYGAMAGSGMAVLIAALLARYYCAVPSTDRAFEWQKIARFAAPASLFGLVLAGLTSLDIFLVKALLGENEQAGLYTAAVVLAQMPYLLLFGMRATLFPVVTQSLSDPTYRQTGFYINHSLRYSLLALTPITFLTAATSEGLISLVYTARYATAANPLRILIFGYMFLSIFLIATTIIMAAGKPKIAMGLGFLMIGLDFVLNRALIPEYGLKGACLGTTVTGFVGALGGLAYVYW